MSLEQVNAVEFDFQIHIDEILDIHKDFLQGETILSELTNEKLDELEFQLDQAMRNQREEVNGLDDDVSQFYSGFSIAEEFLKKYS